MSEACRNNYLEAGTINTEDAFCSKRVVLIDLGESSVGSEQRFNITLPPYKSGKHTERYRLLGEMSDYPLRTYDGQPLNEVDIIKKDGGGFMWSYQIILN